MTKSAMQELAESFGLTAEEFSEFAKAIEAVDVSPKAELMHRLNLRVQGVDPGLPVNWKGERGFAIV